jgi:hypothetical protein
MKAKQQKTKARKQFKKTYTLKLPKMRNFSTEQKLSQGLGFQVEQLGTIRPKCLPS